MKIRKKPVGHQNIIGARIAEIRKEKEISQKDFIAMLQTQGMNINPSSFSKLEGQTRQITDKEIEAIARALDVSIDCLFRTYR